MSELNMENNNVDISNLEDTEVDNTTLLEEPVEEEISQEIEDTTPPSNPWDNAPSNVYFYEKIYEDGHLGSSTESAEQAYRMGWDIVHNYIPIKDTDISDINNWIYKKELCPHKTQEQIQQELVNQRIAQIKSAVQNTLDLKAKEKDYDTAVSLASYVTSTDDEFHEQANRFIAWRDQCWRKCFEIIGLFNNGDIPMPTVGEVLRQLPTLDWE